MTGFPATPAPAPPSRGFFSPLLLLLVCLLLTPLMALASFAWEEELLAAKVQLGRRAAHLAEYGTWEWIARAAARESGFDPGLPAAPYVPWSSAAVAGRLGPDAYRAVASLRPDLDDLDNDPLTTVVRHDRSFGFPDAPRASGGYPVVDLLASGTVGVHQATLAVALTLTPYDHPMNGAVTANGPLLLTGPLTVDGRPPAAPGETPSPAGLPAVASGGEVTTVGPVERIDGAEPPGAQAGFFFRDPCAVLGLPAGSRYLERRRFLAGTPPPWRGTAHWRGSYRGPVAGEGTLIVHNPSFDPLRHLASWEYSLGIPNENFDPAYSHLDPERFPAVLEIQGASSFRGLIVADEMAPGVGGLHLDGQLVILSPLPTSLGMSDGLEVRYDPAAIREVAHGELDHILSWRKPCGTGN